MRNIYYGIRSIEINGFGLTVVKLLFDRSFDTSLLPKECRVETTRKGKIMVSYCSPNSLESNRVVEQVGKACKAHAIKRLNQRYYWVVDQPELPFEVV